jgi:ATP-citrate lyase beta-subunit
MSIVEPILTEKYILHIFKFKFDTKTLNMPLLNINEITAKSILYDHLPKYLSNNLKLISTSIQANVSTRLQDLNNLGTSLVLKPDMLFGKRYKNGLVFLGLNKLETINKIQELSKSQTTLLSGHKGVLTNFIIEPLCPYKDVLEHYLLIEMGPKYDKISYSISGGVDIEDNLNTLKTIDYLDVNSILELSEDKQVIEFITATYEVFKKAGFMELELNPFVISNNEIYLLDCVAKLDSYALSTNTILNSLAIEPIHFGAKALSEFEERVIELDKTSGSSLKLNILNPNGQIWGLYSGGGASLALLDTLAQEKPFDLIANYGEYSGNPTFNEVYEYTNVILDAISHTNHKGTNCLLVAGAIANFTDIEVTLSAISKALKDNIYKLDYSKLVVFCRRAGPKYQQGLTSLITTCDSLKIPIQAFGPQLPLCRIISLIPTLS